MPTQLETLLGGYYHQDADFTNDLGPTELYLGDASAQECRALLVELTRFLSETGSDVDLEAQVNTMGSHLYLGSDPAAYRGWLEEIARRVRAHLGD